MDQFDIAVLGDEPGGIWLANCLSSAIGGTRSVCWLSFGETDSCIFPATYGPLFGIEGESPWSCEIITPTKTVKWGIESLNGDYPGIQEIFKRTSFCHQPELSTKWIRHYPELLFYSQAIWRFLGRSEKISPPHLLYQALCCTQFFNWNPATVLSNSIEKIFLENPTRIEMGKHFVVHTKKTVIRSSILILNTSVKHMFSLIRDTVGLDKIVSVQDSLSEFALYPITVEADAIAIPVALKGLIFYLDADGILDLAREVWPVVFTQAHPGTLSMTAWVCSRWEPQLETLLESFRTVLGRLHTVFPFLARNTLGLSVPLGLDSCFSQTQRAHFYSLVTKRRRPLFKTSQWHGRTRVKNLYCLYPSLNSHYPYPIGSLIGAADVMKELLGARHKSLELFRALN